MKMGGRLVGYEHIRVELSSCFVILSTQRKYLNSIRKRGEEVSLTYLILKYGHKIRSIDVYHAYEIKRMKRE
ncbi:MAG: hypothetical protein BWY45_03210 [Euryarchaeota archaeon ADurb.Bin294]|nr:MAG: hypothetical protein BWY45_03210 [Euryarchaeota archaeon ADurb.Bin294]